ncbi:MAG: ferric reductase-like transmembrane domain-containing protein [Candidatus Moranbacteria bacterium]|nr:ferric reductase-like transmembrane domain-containing protein [Candidatus Moranbacteria bacterium]
MTGFSQKFLGFMFAAHDLSLGFLVRNTGFLKVAILVSAHASLLGIFFPDLRRSFGEVAGSLLIVILFLSPLVTITGMPLFRAAMGFRREFGILMGYLAIVHGAGYFLDPNYFDAFIMPHLGPDFFAMDPQPLLGVIGIILTFPLLLTSNAFALKNLGGKNWKWVHVLVYPMFVSVVLHRFSGGNEDGSLSGALEAFLLIGSYALLKYLAWKRGSFLSLRKQIDSITGRYKESLLTKERDL